LTRVALTFDDGPSEWTPAVLDLLREHEALATFFLIGERVRERPETARRIAADGHELGSHTLTHPRLTSLDPDALRVEIAGGVKAVEQATGRRPRLFRAPRFQLDAQVLEVVAELGLESVLADVDPEDWLPGRDSHTIFRLVLAGLRPNAIVDLHDGLPPPPTRARDDCAPTVEALEHLLPCLRAEGYEPVTVSELS
jgi:peptidoglycan/xylan/chitin deacetylase (PgdA/CDA1 family)